MQSTTCGEPADFMIGSAVAEGRAITSPFELNTWGAGEVIGCETNEVCMALEFTCENVVVKYSGELGRLKYDLVDRGYAAMREAS